MYILIYIYIYISKDIHVYDVSLLFVDKLILSISNFCLYIFIVCNQKMDEWFISLLGWPTSKGRCITFRCHATISVLLFQYWSRNCSGIYLGGFDFYFILILTKHAPHVPSIITQNHFLEGLLPLYRQCTEDELKLCPGDWKYGSFYTTLLTDPRLYQEWAKQR